MIITVSGHDHSYVGRERIARRGIRAAKPRGRRIWTLIPEKTFISWLDVETEFDNSRVPTIQQMVMQFLRTVRRMQIISRRRKLGSVELHKTVTFAISLTVCSCQLEESNTRKGYPLKTGPEQQFRWCNQEVQFLSRESRWSNRSRRAGGEWGMLSFKTCIASNPEVGVSDEIPKESRHGSITKVLTSFESKQQISPWYQWSSAQHHRPEWRNMHASESRT